MNSRSERRKIIYNNLYKKYLIQLEKVAEQKKRNMLLKSTNNELCKKVILLREEVRKSAARNSFMKAEIYDLAKDRKKIMDKNKSLYDTLTSLHNDASAVEKRLGNILDSSSPDIKFYGSQNNFSVPAVNGQVIENPKASLFQSETNYPKYNFKDCIYIQDLSPVMEENADVKKLTKPPDITRRLGHRAKVLQLNTSPGNFEAVSAVVHEESNSPCPVGLTETDEEMKKLGNQLHSAEPGIRPNAVVNNSELSSSATVSVELNSTSAAESILSTSYLPELSVGQQSAISNLNEKESAAKISESPLLTINVLSPSDCEDTLKDSDFHPSIFVNVFPRRKKLNNLGCSLPVGSIEDQDGLESHQEPNSTFIEKEDSRLKKHLFSSRKSSVDKSSRETQNNSVPINSINENWENTIRSETRTSVRTSKESIIDKSWVDSQEDATDLEFSALDKESKKKTSKASLRNSLDNQTLKVLSKSQDEEESGDLNKEVYRISESKADQSSFNEKDEISESCEDEVTENKKKLSRTSKSRSPKSSCNENMQLCGSKSSGDENTGNKEKSLKTTKRSLTESSIESSPTKKTSPNSSLGKNGNIFLLQRSSDRISDQRAKRNISNKEASPKSLQEKKNEIQFASQSQKIIDRAADKSTMENFLNKDSSPKPVRDTHNDEIVSERPSKSSSVSREKDFVKDFKKDLRSKKPINFVESPVLPDKKRQRRKKKAT